MSKPSLSVVALVRDAGDLHRRGGEKASCDRLRRVRQRPNHDRRHGSTDGTIFVLEDVVTNVPDLEVICLSGQSDMWHHATPPTWQAWSTR